MRLLSSDSLRTAAYGPCGAKDSDGFYAVLGTFSAPFKQDVDNQKNLTAWVDEWHETLASAEESARKHTVAVER